jgi:hypothetical protein
MNRNNTSDNEPVDSLSDREVRALTEAMVAFGGDGGVFTVVGENGGGEYRVDIIEGRCTCPDAKHNLSADERCKHEFRVAFASGRCEIPEWVDGSAVDDNLGALVDDVTAATTEASAPVAATDGGAEFTYHNEQASGAEFVRCESCGRECVPPRRDRLTHTDDCPVRGDDR